MWLIGWFIASNFGFFVIFVCFCLTVTFMLDCDSIGLLFVLWAWVLFWFGLDLWLYCFSDCLLLCGFDLRCALIWFGVWWVC